MDEKQNTVSEENRLTEASSYDRVRDESESGIGTGKKVGFYGCGFLMLAGVIVFIVLVLTGIYNPFEGTEGVGP